MPEPIFFNPVEGIVGIGKSHFVRAASKSHADYQSKTGIALLSEAPEGYGDHQTETRLGKNATKMQHCVLSLGQSFHRAPTRLRKIYTSDTDTTFQTEVVFEAYHHSP
jgi:hypothetical protein